MQIKKWLALLLAAVMLVTILPGCGSDSYEGESSGSKRKRDTRSAGLYESGTKNRIKTWDELVDEGVVMVIGGEVVTGWNKIANENTSSEKLYGDLVLDKDITKIGEYAFACCNRLTGISIPNGVTSIGNAAFEHCSRLTEVNIPDGVSILGEMAFFGCSSLTSVTIPESITTIEERAFDCCSSLTSVTIPENITTIEESAFANCSSLTSITIPEGVITIGEFAFSSCRNLQSIIIPSSISSIGWAFGSCDQLTSITFNGAREQWKNICNNSKLGLAADTEIVCTDGTLVVLG